ncbi:hypothetical protein [Modicisalibacter luteus]|uniref:Type II toxin-antitoxin system prevent-host-death family antitoxin n=1 Tax=Modicisalibacter luteus TaxID=453962 RepID=A0ABV7M3J8_9GAMM|nr:hypothetical protein [Halomonas lutea]GHA84609.1 hypothetical protein GCM10007159_02090 [Halomonas lutea]
MHNHRQVTQRDRQIALLGQAMAVLRMSGSGKETVDRETRFKAAGARCALPSRQTEPAAVQPVKTQIKHHAASEDEWEAF